MNFNQGESILPDAGYWFGSRMSCTDLLLILSPERTLFVAPDERVPRALITGFAERLLDPNSTSGIKMIELLRSLPDNI